MTSRSRLPKDPDKLYFPCEIENDIGVPRNAIGAMRRKGCPFYGRKTTIRWVREFIAKQAGAIPSAREGMYVIEFFDGFADLVRARIEAGRR